MSKLLQTLVDGLAYGSIYASLSLALVLVHRATHIPNFAQGEMAMVSAYLAWEVQSRIGSSSVLAWVIAVLSSMLLSFVLGFLIERGIIRWVENASPLTLLIITLGLLTIIQNAAGWYWGFLPERPFSPLPTKPIRVGDTVLSWQNIGIVLVLIALLVVVFVLFKYTKLGLGLRGAASNPGSARLVGINVGLMLAIGWGLAAAVGSTAGVMIAPKLGALTPTMMSSIMLFAFAGAVLGGFDSPPGAVIGGLLVGLIESFTKAYWQPHGNNLNLVIAGVVILAVLLVKPNGLFGKAAVSRV
ncbi:branched-chain amino acid ABC transporter permease [Desertimonas flava]|uniref:branched-chain amino acid ABC transporter permease n=1 Tax=Desertimonas flava TaxID=2064846 RepID=UPI0013C4DDC3|nr:branched-chain amino acid ABC transporter permease [Desertimonas flava]